MSGCWHARPWAQSCRTWSVLRCSRSRHWPTVPAARRPAWVVAHRGWKCYPWGSRGAESAVAGVEGRVAAHPRASRSVTEEWRDPASVSGHHWAGHRRGRGGEEAPAQTSWGPGCSYWKGVAGWGRRASGQRHFEPPGRLSLVQTLSCRVRSDGAAVPQTRFDQTLYRSFGLHVRGSVGGQAVQIGRQAVRGVRRWAGKRVGARGWTGSCSTPSAARPTAAQAQGGG